MKCDNCGVDECETRDIVLKKYPYSALHKIIAKHIGNCSSFIPKNKDENKNE